MEITVAHMSSNSGKQTILFNYKLEFWQKFSQMLGRYYKVINIGGSVFIFYFTPK